MEVSKSLLETSFAVQNQQEQRLQPSFSKKKKFHKNVKNEQKFCFITVCNSTKMCFSVIMDVSTNSCIKLVVIGSVSFGRECCYVLFRGEKGEGAFKAHNAAAAAKKRAAANQSKRINGTSAC